MVDTPPASAPVQQTPPSQVLAEQRAGNRESAIAALKQLRETSEQVAAPPTPEQKPVEVPADAPAEVAAPAEPAAAPEPATPAATPAATPPAAPPEPPTELPGMAQLRKQEQHLRRQIAAERQQMQADLEAKQREWQVKLDKAAELEKKYATARQDPFAALQALGFSEQDYDALGRLIYAASPSGKKDPNTAAAAAQELARATATRETTSELATLRKEITELKQAQVAAQQQAQAQAAIDAYMGKVSKAISDDAPLTRAAMNKNPERTKAIMMQLADQLWQESGPSDDLRDAPTPSDVIAAYERLRAAELEELGIDPKTIGRAAAPAASPSVAPAARPATTIAPSSVAAPTAPKPNGPPSREEVLAGLAKLRTV